MIVVTLEAIQAAYAKHPEIKVCCRLFRKIVDGKLVACCPMSILALEDGLNLLDDNVSVMDWIKERIEPAAQEFWRGFDARNWYDPDTENKYYLLGRKARDLVLPDA